MAMQLIYTLEPTNTLYSEMWCTIDLQYKVSIMSISFWLPVSSGYCE